MKNIPLEVIIRHSSHKIGDYFAEKVFEERKSGKVAILVEDFTNSLYFMPCDIHGYPNFHMFNYMTYESLDLTVANTNEYTSDAISKTVEEVSIYIEYPMLTQRYNWEDKPYVFMWKGRIMNKKKIPLEKLNISELMKLAQKAVANREGLIIDEAIKNKIYK